MLLGFAAVQAGIRVAVMVYAPNGQKVIEFDCRPHEPTPISVIAADAGPYRIDVRSLEKEAAIGGYQLKVEEVRQATAQDRTRIAAERAFAEGERLQTEWKLESSRKAINQYEAAIKQWEITGDQHEEARALKTIGEVHQRMGEPQQALNCFEHGLALNRQPTEPRLEGELLNAIGFAYLHLGENQKALMYCERALKLNQDIGNQQGEARSLNSIAEIHYYGGELQKALGYHQQALALWQSLKRRRSIISTAPCRSCRRPKIGAAKPMR
jgi:tetratricopeptide (TPR) repeat protein